MLPTPSALVLLSSLLLVGGLALALARLVRVHRELQAAAADSAAQQARFLLLCQRSPLGLYQLDTERRCLYANRQLEEITGRAAEELLGPGLLEAVHPEDREVVRRGQARASCVGRQYSREFRLLLASGEVRWVHLHEAPLSAGGTPCGHVGIVEDVTERRRLAEERELEQAREGAEARRAAETATASARRLRRLLEAIPDGIAVYRGRRLVYVNAAFVTHLGYDEPSQLVGRALSEVIGSGDRDRLDDTISQRIRRSIPADRFSRLTERVHRRDGSSIAAEITALSIDHEGEPATLLIVRDITERLALQAQLVRADRLSALGTLAAGIAHEINNPLCYVVANLDLLGEEARRCGGPSCPGRGGQLIREAMEGAERVRRIVRDLRALVHPGGERDEEDATTDLPALLDSTLNVAAHEIRHRAEVVRDYAAVPAVRGGSGRLGQVFLNLVINAAQSIESGTSATNRIRLSVRCGAPGWVDVEIEDTGCGIPASQLEHVFDPFFTTKPVGTGTGLGLAICHGIVTSLGGHIALDSAPGRGTRARVSLPAAAERRLALPPAAEPEAPSTRLAVLVVDDEVMVGRALGRILGAEHDVSVVHSAREALDRLRVSAFDVVLCDLMMPDMTGMDLYHEVQTRLPGVEERFVFMTGGAFTARARDFLGGVPNQRVEKPFDPKGLRALLRDRARLVAVRGRGGGETAGARPGAPRLWCAQM